MLQVPPDINYSNLIRANEYKESLSKFEVLDVMANSLNRQLGHSTISRLHYEK